MENKIRVLKLLADNLNENNIRWGVGASMLMYLKGINVAVNDIDILIDINDLLKFQGLVDQYSYIKELKSLKYPTSHFFELTIDNVDIDIMFNFKVQTKETIYHYPFDIELLDFIFLDESKIYLLSLKDWLNAYKAMERTGKVSLLEKHIKNG